MRALVERVFSVRSLFRVQWLKQISVAGQEQDGSWTVPGPQ